MFFFPLETTIELVFEKSIVLCRWGVGVGSQEREEL